MDSQRIHMAEISRATDIPCSTISNWIRYDRHPPVDLAARIANILGVSIEWMLTGVEPYEDYDEDTDSERIVHLFGVIRQLDETQLDLMEPVLDYMVNKDRLQQKPTLKKKR